MIGTSFNNFESTNSTRSSTDTTDCFNNFESTNSTRASNDTQTFYENRSSTPKCKSPIISKILVDSIKIERPELPEYKELKSQRDIPFFKLFKCGRSRQWSGRNFRKSE